MVPRQIPLRVEKRILVRHGDDTTRVPNLLATDAHLVARDPQHRRRARHGRVVIGIALRLGRVDDVGEIAGHEATHGVVIGVLVRTQPFGEEVWFLVRGQGEVFFVGGGRGGGAVLGEAVVSGGGVFDGVFGPGDVAVHGVAILEREEVFFFGFERFGQVHEERVDGGVEGDVEEDDEDEEGDHEDDGTGGGGCAEETDQADRCQIYSHCGLL